MSYVYNPIKVNVLVKEFEKKDNYITIPQSYSIVLEAYGLKKGDDVNYRKLLNRMALDRKSAIEKENEILVAMFDVVMVLIVYMSLKNTLSMGERRDILKEIMKPAKKLGFEIAV